MEGKRPYKNPRDGDYWNFFQSTDNISYSQFLVFRLIQTFTSLRIYFILHKRLLSFSSKIYLSFRDAYTSHLSACRYTSSSTHSLWFSFSYIRHDSSVRNSVPSFAINFSIVVVIFFIKYKVRNSHKEKWDSYLPTVATLSLLSMRRAETRLSVLWIPLSVYFVQGVGIISSRGEK